MSHEDGTVVSTPLKKNYYLGGAGIVASHVKKLGSKCDFYSVLGNNKEAKIVKKFLSKSKINCNIFEDPGRLTTLKQRFKTINTNLLRLNTYSTNEISLNIQDKIFKMFEKNVAKYDVIFSDFNYGCLPQRLVEKIIKVSKNNITITADSQSSSQLGNISRYHNTKLITPTEEKLD